ncbi:MAG: carboxypeptidase-like regulatory domain-containing protein [Spirosomataceae bacterium]
MQTPFQIQVSNPCHEDWTNFTPTPEGGFCASCQKNVVDFTQMSDAQLMAFFRNQTSENATCGRFRESQLERAYQLEEWFPTDDSPVPSFEIPVQYATKNIFTWKQYLKNAQNVTIGVLIMTLAEQGFGQSKILSGKIVDAGNKPIAGASIILKGTKRGTITNGDGFYKLAVPDTATIIICSFGHIKLEKKSSDINPTEKLKFDIEALKEEVVVVGYTKVKKEDVVGGKISLTPSKISVKKQKTELLILGNPSAEENILVVPKVSYPANYQVTAEDQASETWFVHNAFQHIEALSVYDFAGNVVTTDYTKLNDGQLQLNLKHVPAGEYILRVAYTNQNCQEKMEIRLAKLVLVR